MNNEKKLRKALMEIDMMQTALSTSIMGMKSRIIEMEAHNAKLREAWMQIAQIRMEERAGE